MDKESKQQNELSQVQAINRLCMVQFIPVQSLASTAGTVAEKSHGRVSRWLVNSVNEIMNVS